MFVAAAVCPHPPLLLPAVAAGAAPELADLRAACWAALDELLDAGLDRLVVVGGGADLHTDAAGGSLRRFGVDVHVGRPGDASLPLSLTVGAWLLEQCDHVLPPTEYVGLGDAPQSDCAARLAAIVTGPDRVGVLAMADLSAKRTESSPGYVDARARPFDAEVVGALSAVDLPKLLGLDAELAREVWCSGVPALAALAGAARTTHERFVARIHADVAPYGVGYVVVSWRAG